MLAAWQREKTQPGFRLKAFVTARFDLPTDGAVPFQSNVAAGLRHHLDTLWTVLARQRGNGELLGYRPALEAEYRYWIRGAEPLKPGTGAQGVVRLPGGALLNRYWDASDQSREESFAENVAAAKQSPQPPAQFCRNVRTAATSGWGFSSRWFRAGVLLRLLNRYEPK